MREELKDELRESIRRVLRMNGLRLVMRTNAGEYWKSKQGKEVAMIVTLPDGEPTVQRLDR